MARYRIKSINGIPWNFYKANFKSVKELTETEIRFMLGQPIKFVFSCGWEDWTAIVGHNKE